MDKKDINEYRYFLKDYLRLKTDFSQTDQNQGLEPPPVEKDFDPRGERIPLTAPGNWKSIKDIGIINAIKKRRSRRKYTENPLSIEELSFLLWSTQGIRKNLGSTVLRNTPSAGNRHPFETYLCILNVPEIAPGIYRYLPLENELIKMAGIEKKELAQKIGLATLGQFFAGISSVLFVWAAVPYRTEWRYGIASHKVIAVDVGHVCQNLYLACETIRAGTCAIAAYDQKLMDELIGVDGEDEFVVYLAPVGKR